jgi:undecaprenyl-diphosphatase
LDFEHLVMLTELGGALWYGGKTRIGRTFWRSIDASVFTAITTTAMKYAFSRARPRQSKSPDRWFQGNCCQSFPSGEVSFQASFVTPFIVEYRKQYPWVWALEALPAYDALARMKVHGHWQTDVLAAWAIGTAWGIYAHDEPKGLIIGFMPNGVIVGFGVHF